MLLSDGVCASVKQMPMPSETDRERGLKYLPRAVQVELDLMSHWMLMENLCQCVNEGLWLSGYRSGRLLGYRFKSLKRSFMNYYGWHKRDF